MRAGDPNVSTVDLQHVEREGSRPVGMPLQAVSAIGIAHVHAARAMPLRPLHTVSVPSKFTRSPFHQTTDSRCDNMPWEREARSEQQQPARTRKRTPRFASTVPQTAHAKNQL